MTTKLTFRHLRNTKNIGDAKCSPFEYLDWSGLSNVEITVGDIREEGDPYDIGVFGGGKILRNLASQPGFNPLACNVGWGISTVQRNPYSLKYNRAKKALALIGSRDWESNEGMGGYDWVPCASSQHPFFQKIPEPTHELVFYSHHAKTKTMRISVPDEIPALSNNSASIDASLNFIASGDTVVSNSYHGVFWALLMGRKVLCIPFSNKFSHYRLPPGYATPQNWLSRLSKSQSQPELRFLCHEATEHFYEKFLDFVSEFSKSTRQ